MTSNDQESPERVESMLVCPLTLTPLSLDAANQRLISKAALGWFPIVDQVPDLRLDSFVPFSESLTANQSPHE